MTASAASTLLPGQAAKAIESECPERAHQLPLHNAPSLHDMLALKRQRRSLDEGAVEPSQQQQQQDVEAAPPVVSERQSPAERASTSEPARGTGAAVAGEAAAPHTTDFLAVPTFATPLLPGTPGEPMSAYFQRLRESLTSPSSSASQSHPQLPLPELSAVTSPQLDGVYLHKRPIRAPNGGLSPLAVCGSVLHHVIVLVKQGPLLHSLDFGPANGADVTANVLEAALAKKILATTDTGRSCGITSDAAPAPGTAQDELPYMYLGAPAVGVDHPLLQQLVRFAESRPYHALTNNCIHFADAAVRLLTAGAVRGAPLLYDIKYGSVPAVDNPMLLMMQLMLRMPWFVVVDGSPLTAAFLEHLRAAGESAAQPQQATDPRVSMTDPEDCNNNNDDVAGAAARGAASAAAEALAVDPAPSAVGGAGGLCAGAPPASGNAAAQGLPVEQDSVPELGEMRQGVASRQGSGLVAQQEDRERRQELENDQAS